MRRLTTTLGVPLDPTTRRQLEEMAEKDGRPVATYVRRLIVAALTAQQQQRPNGGADHG